MQVTRQKISLGSGWLLLAVCLLLLCTPAAASGAWTVEPISGTTPEPIAADVSGRTIVSSVAWGDAMDSSTPRGILLCDAYTKTTTVIANSTGRMTVTGANIDGDHVVWFDEPQLLVDEKETSNLLNTIYLYSVSEGTTKEIYSSPTAEWPKVSGNHILWSESPENTWIDAITVYDIEEGAAQDFPNIRVDDPASVVLDGDHIAYRDATTWDLTLYDLASGETTVIAPAVRTNTTHALVEDFAMGGDYVLYTTRTLIDEGKHRDETITLSLYTISTNATELISPTKGLAEATDPKPELAATVDSPFTDGTTIGWVLVTGISASDVIITTPAGDDPTLLAIDGDAAFPAIDGNRVVWVQSKLFSDSHVVLATQENTVPLPAGTPEPTPTPGFGVAAFGALAALALLRAKKE